MLHPLKLLILYDARSNTYTICGHNLTAEEAEAQAAEWRRKQLPALIVEQRARHRTTDTEACRACRRDVKRSSGLEPQPQFQKGGKSHDTAETA